MKQMKSMDKMSDPTVRLSPMDKLGTMIEDARIWLISTSTAEVESGYDIDLTMERMECQGYLLGLENAYNVLNGHGYKEGADE